MAEQTAIEWCDATFNPWIGCTRISPACDDCYAARSTAARSLGVAWGPGKPRRRTSDANWKAPIHWNAKAAREGRRFRVFCASLADVFDNEVPPEWRQELFELIRSTPHLDWLLLTKRIGNAKAMIDEALSNMDIGYSVPFAAWPWPNVWLGATVVNQEEANRDIPKLLAVPARVRFLSIEPMLGPVYVEDIPDPVGGVCLKPLAGLRWVGDGQGRCTVRSLGGRIDWIICGGESGPHARPMHPDWARSLRDQCAAAGVPFLFKQWGEWVRADQHPDQTNDSLYTRDLSQLRHPSAAIDATGATRAHADDLPHQATASCVHRVGKKAAGRLLDGAEHNGFPEAR